MIKYDIPVKGKLLNFCMGKSIHKYLINKYTFINKVLVISNEFLYLYSNTENMIDIF